MTYGYNKEGLVLPSYDEMLEKWFTNLENKRGTPVDRSIDGSLGQLAEISVLFYLENWEFIERFYQNFRDPEGEYLSIKAGYLNITRKGASFSSSNQLFTGELGTVIPAGTITKSEITDEPFKTKEEITIQAGNLGECLIKIDTSSMNGKLYQLRINGTLVVNYTGTTSTTITTLFLQFILGIQSAFPYLEVTQVSGSTELLSIFSAQSDLPFFPQPVESCSMENYSVYSFSEATNPGNIEVPANKLSVLDSPITGIDSVRNPSPAQRGKEQENDFELNQRLDFSKRVSGGGSISAIRAKLLENLPSVSWCKVFENYTNEEDENGLPPHSFQVVLEGGSETDIVQTIFDTKPCGIRAFGELVYPISDSASETVNIGFSRPVPQYAWIKVTILKKNKEEVFPNEGIKQVEQSIFDFCREDFEIGDDLLVQKIYSPVFTVPGIKEIKIEIAITGTPDDIPVYQETDLSIKPSEYLTFSLNEGKILVLDESL